VDRKNGRFARDLESTTMINQRKNMLDAKRLGAALRHLRVARKWSLKDFQTHSGGAIKDVVLGSYERGTRSISVAKLIIISQVYQVPIHSFFLDTNNREVPKISNSIIVDLRKLRNLPTNDFSNNVLLLRQFTHSIIALRNDWNGEVLSLRSSDMKYLSMLSDNSVANLYHEFETLEILMKIKG
jgi:transcriptional regulator with XRE-family HTH domain